MRLRRRFICRGGLDVVSAVEGGPASDPAKFELQIATIRTLLAPDRQIPGLACITRVSLACFAREIPRSASAVDRRLGRRSRLLLESPSESLIQSGNLFIRATPRTPTTTKYLLKNSRRGTGARRAAIGVEQIGCETRRSSDGHPPFRIEESSTVELPGILPVPQIDEKGGSDESFASRPRPAMHPGR